MRVLTKEFLHNPISTGNPHRTSMENAFIYLLPVLTEFEVIEDETESYDVLLAPVYTTGFDFYRKFAAENPGVFKIIGGWHPSLMPEEMLQFSDAVIVGPGESILPDVIKGKKKGIFHGQTINLKPVRKRADFRMTSVGLDSNHRMMSIRTRIGCTESCSFCCTPPVYHRQSYSLGLETFEEDIKDNKGRFTDVFLTDTDIFQHTESDLERICQTIRDVGLRGHAFISSKYFTDKKFSILEDNNWFRILVGVEGKCTAHYGKANRNIREIRDRCQRAGIVFTGGFIFSRENPIESFEDLCWDIMPDQMTFSFLCPYPGTVLGRAHGIKSQEYWSLNGFDNAYMFTEDVKGARQRLAEFCLRYYTSPQYQQISKMTENDLCLLSTKYYYDLTHKNGEKQDEKI